MTKLAQGMLDLHSKRGAADLEALAAVASRPAAATSWRSASARANTVAEAFADGRRGRRPARRCHRRQAWHTAAAVLRDAGIALEILVFDREGVLMGKTPFRPGS